jgi:hypothetical protein
MIVNCAKGGLGNQLFQHVFATSLASRFGAEMRTDISYYDADPYGFSASVWNLNPNAKKTTIAEHCGPGSYLLKEGQIRALDQIEKLPSNTRNLILDGYWQGENYFDYEVARQTYSNLRALVEHQIDPGLLVRLKACPNAVAMHVRRRDYGHMGVCKNSYYIAAIEHLRENEPDTELFVFSDEPNFTRHLLMTRNLNFTPVATGSDLVDLYLMSLCHHFVISNSSYSWWGAWFGEMCGHKPGGLVIAPKDWVTIDATPSPCPARWLQLTDAVQSFLIDPSELVIQAERLKRLWPRE